MINYTMLDSGGNHPERVTDIAKEKFSHMHGVTDRISSSIGDKYVQFPNGEEISVEEIKEKLINSCNKIIEKYGFSGADSIEFKRSITLHPPGEVPGHPSLRGVSFSDVICTGDRRSLSELSTRCNIYINPSLIGNRDFYFAILFHELDHHAFYFKKFKEMNIDSISSVEGRQTALNLFSHETTQDDNYSFHTELMARVDTADELMDKGISWDKVWNYGPGDEGQTTGEPFYSDSISYAKKFLRFQIGLYNLLGEDFGFDNNKTANHQLTQQADIHFQKMMKIFRNSIISSRSIEDSKHIIDGMLQTLYNSGSRREFASAINYNL